MARKSLELMQMVGLDPDTYLDRYPFQLSGGQQQRIGVARAFIDAFSTDGMLLEYELVVLEDDKSFFPPYHAVPVSREDTAQKHPEIARELKKPADFISDDTMRELNYKVDVLKEDPKNVAEEFLKSSGIID